MLVLSRGKGETVVITTPSGERIRVQVAKLTNNKVRLCFDAPRDFEIMRQEVAEQREGLGG